jgi:threonine/homoserine/homoserine lactone efflux protein
LKIDHDAWILMTSATLLTFFLASVLLALTPGPDNIFVITHSVLRGWKAGFSVVIGLCTGLLVHTTAVALGVAVILQTSTWALTALKSVGAAYLLYLAWQAFTAPALKGGADKHHGGFFWSYRRGIIMNVTNPKVSLFFLAFLPQFVPTDVDSATFHIVVLGALFALATVLVFGAMAVLAARLSTWLTQSDVAQKRLNAAAGLVFIALALHLVLGL